MSADGAQHQPVRNLLDKLKESTKDRDSLTFGAVMDAVGRNSFASLMLVIGLIMMVPGPADIPGVPTLLGGIVILLAVQMLMNRDHVWIPSWVERRELKSETIKKMIAWLRKPAQWIDSIARPRLSWLINRGSISVLDLAAIAIALSTPFLEFIPMSANVAGVAIAAFGLAILARDGLIAAVSVVTTIGLFSLVIYQLI
ncbi:exopolysaccharide biosynthesis protein [Roseiconus lacunae]|uniref:exopolysaccharide biosynthesis protein n=1 Tax=Roseiconus lacunae TaxID=2605694 RepID=UPI00308906D5|nr:exopolysaccharide biosynthesis protein [Stieleria sp. HD01]